MFKHKLPLVLFGIAVAFTVPYATVRAAVSTPQASAPGSKAISLDGFRITPSEVGQVIHPQTTVGAAACSADACLEQLVVGPMASDPGSALRAAQSLPGVPTAPAAPPPTSKVLTPSTGYTYSYVASEWCRSGYGGCNAWHTWVKGTVHWDNYSVWYDWVDCSDTGASFGYSVQVTWCGVWNNGAAAPFNYMDLGENWYVFCCTGLNFGTQQSYWQRIDIYKGGGHGTRGGGG